MTYGYTNRNQLKTVSVGGTNLASYAYDGNGNALTKTLSNGTLASYSYDNANNLTTVNHALSGTSFARFDYGYDDMNRRTYEQRNSASGDTYTYDAVDQVAGVNYDATNPTSGSSGTDRTVGYTYDDVGNRTEVNDTVNGNASYSANNLNQYTSVGSTSYDYDDNGNLTSGNGTFVYDAQNRLTSASVAVTNETLGYDSKNRVVQRSIGGTTTYLIYDGWDLIEERNGSNAVLATYVHGAKEDELLTRTDSSGNTVYYHHNALGSVTALTNVSGAVVEKYKYDAFGAPTITTASGGALTLSAYGNRFMFTGREYLAELGLYDYRNRVYSPSLGRFLQTDPIRFDAGDVNIYRYCGNSITNMGDPTGMGRFNNGTNGGALAAQQDAVGLQNAENVLSNVANGVGDLLEAGMQTLAAGADEIGAAAATLASDAGSLVPDGAENPFDDVMDSASQAAEPYGPGGEKAAGAIDIAKDLLDMASAAKEDLSEFADTMSAAAAQQLAQANANMQNAMQPPTIAPIPTALPPDSDNDSEDDCGN